VRCFCLLPPLPAQPSTLGADDDLLRRYGIALQRPLSAKERALPQPLDPKLRVDLLRRPGGFVAAGGHYAAEREPRFRVCDQCGAAVPEASAWLCGLCSETYCSPKCQEGGKLPSACAHPPLSLRRSAPPLPACSVAGPPAGLPVRRSGRPRRRRAPQQPRLWQQRRRLLCPLMRGRQGRCRKHPPTAHARPRAGASGHAAIACRRPLICLGVRGAHAPETRVRCHPPERREDRGGSVATVALIVVPRGPK